MTEEQAIKIAKDFTKMDFSNPMGWTGYYDTELKELSQAIEIVLNMLKEKDEEIEKKDKIIDLMAEFIEKVTVDLKIAFGENMLWNRNEIKQYFEREAKSDK